MATHSGNGDSGGGGGPAARVIEAVRCASLANAASSSRAPLPSLPRETLFASSGPLVPLRPPPVSAAIAGSMLICDRRRRRSSCDLRLPAAHRDHCCSMQAATRASPLTRHHHLAHWPTYFCCASPVCDVN
ncbi:hypothetical protein DAI22_01g254500 [Oryza sativa Japonica Group]|nr:hypothetical protein DAI22_01g254500 [Oryza sativa Japonica Group]